MPKKKKNELPHKNQPYTKINSKLIMDLNVRAKIIEHLQESTEKTSWSWIRLRDVRYNTKSMRHKIKKIDKLDFIKIKNFRASKDTLRNWKDKPQRKSLQITSDNGLYPEHIKNSNSSIIRKQTTQLKYEQKN